MREAVGLTQELFAIRLDVSLPSVKRWELGTAKPGRLALARLEEFRPRREMSGEEADVALIKKLVVELKGFHRDRDLEPWCFEALARRLIGIVQGHEREEV